ncbi:MAG: phosphatase PAP2 family protein [Sphingobium sp.]
MSISAPLKALAHRYPFEGEVIDYQSRLALHLLLGFMAALLCGMVFKGLRYQSGLTPLFFSTILLWLAGLSFQCLKLHRLGQFLKASAIWLATGLTVALASAVLAIQDRPYVDALLNSWDKILFFDFDWISFAYWVNEKGLLSLILNHAYCTLNWQPFLLFLVFFLTGKPDIAWKTLSALLIGLGFCLIIFPFAPAVGGYAHFGIRPEDVSNILVPAAWKATVLHEQLRAGVIHAIGPDTLDGIITMPSFHAVAAVVLAWGYYQSPLLRWPFLAINGAMLISTVPIGGHYIVDVLAGGLIAACAIWWVNRPVPASHPASRPRALPEPVIAG